MNRYFSIFATWTLAATAVFAAEPETYALRYKFQPGETLRWRVEHRNNVRTSVSGTTQTAETLSISEKRWRVADVRPDGTATFEHRVEWVDMRHKLTGRDEVRYDSRTGAKPPAGFETAAQSVGVPMSIVTIDAHGKLLHRDQKIKPRPAVAPSDSEPQSDGWMTIPLPEEAVPVGHTWSLPLDIDIPREDGGTKRLKAIQQFTLEEVRNGVATIAVSTEVLTPVTDPAIEAQLVQRETSGRVRFDIDAGRVLGQQLDVDKHVVGFRGEASSVHYVNRFSEEFLPGESKKAANTGESDKEQ